MLEFQQKFIEEAEELIDKLETELINFEQDFDNVSIIQELFRIMHTLKGTSAMFGFDRIGKFTHHLEDIYDLIRNKELSINQGIINLTFEAVDFIKLLLLSNENLDKLQEQKFAELLARATKFAATKINFIPETITKVDLKVQPKAILHRVTFKPDPRVLIRGIDPNLIVNEVTSLGNSIKFKFIDESIDTTDIEMFNQYWEIFVSGLVSCEIISDVFMFFDDYEFSVHSLIDNSVTALDQFLEASNCLKLDISLKDLKEQLVDILPIAQEKSTLPQLENTDKLKSTSVMVEETIRVSASKLDHLLNLVSELIIVHSQFENHALRFQDNLLTKTVKDLSKITRNFRDEILSARLIPISILATGMQRLVRDLSLKLDKKVELITYGLHTELDKNIINKIESPLMHIIRNCIDHGVENQDDRIISKKDKISKIFFRASYSGASVFIQIQDDGKGIDPKMITQKALSKGLIKPDAILSPQQIYDLIFLPGFSTATEVTEVSGRGVGLDVVKNVINELHGEINIDSQIGVGTTFTIKLPLTLSIVDALLVDCADFKILVPTNNILFCKYISSEYFQGKDLNYEFEKKCIPVKRLSSIFRPEAQINEFEVLIIISIYEKQYGILVDRIISSLQAVIKPLGIMHTDQPYFIGASELGDGSMAYILDTNFLLKL